MTGPRHRTVKSTEVEQLRPISVRVPEACRLTGIGRSKLYELIATGEIEIVKVGTITLVPVAALTAFIKQRRTGSSAQPMLFAEEERA